MNNLKLGLILLMLAWLAGCSSGALAPESADGLADVADSAADPALEAAATKSVSTTYTYFFRDHVNDASAAKWTVANNNGKKAWVLSTANYFSAPRAWVIGQNYWNYEYDFLESNPFTVPANRSEIRLVFYSKWDIANFDHARVQYKINSGVWTTLPNGDFTNGTNPAYPAWTKYSFTLPSTGASSATYRIRYWFESDASLTDWGFGVDSVSVYQADLATPGAPAASDNTFTDKIRVTWTAPPTGVSPTSYKVYRATSQGGTYTLKATVTTLQYDDTSATQGTTYWYKVAAARNGYPDSPQTAADSGVRSLPASWHVATLDSSGMVGQGPSLRVISGNPAVSYSDDTNFGARYIRATDPNGAGWGSPVQLATGVSVATNSTSLLMVGTNPAVAFQRANVKYIRANDTTGGSWGSIVNVGSTNMQDSINLLLVNGRPAVIGRDPHIEFVRSSDATGSAWPTTTIQADGANRPVSAALVNGFPAVAYTTSTNQLAYRQATHVDGTTWGAQMLVDEEQFNNFAPSLAVINGRPAISFVNGTDLMYVRANDADGDTWPLATSIQTAVPQSGQTSLDTIGGNPAIAFSKFPGVNRHLWYIAASNANGTAWNTAMVLDDDSNVGEYVSLEEVGGRPAIAYYQATGENLKYAAFY